MSSQTPIIFWTKTDEAPALATYSLLPIIQKFTSDSGFKVEAKDISLAGRIIANFPENLNDSQKISDDLSALGELATTAPANIIKLPNISASIPQLKAAIKELQAHGYSLPNYPETLKTEADKKMAARYAKVLGSAVNPVLREGNSDRRVAKAVKEFARSHPHKMGAWSSDSKTHVAHMDKGDFFASEQSITCQMADTVSIQLVARQGKVTTLRADIGLLAGEIIDSSVMDCTALRQFYETQMQTAKEQGLLFSLHLKATMMKISDPILFGHAVSVYYRPVFDKYQSLFKTLGINANNGLGDVYHKIANLPETQRLAIEAEIQACYKHRPELAMVDSDKGITNLHVPSDIIVDASMPAMIRDSGKMWGADGQRHDTKALIPDRCYADIYQETIEHCKKYGAFDPTTMGSVANVGLMAQKAEEYGSHDKTFEAPEQGIIRIVNHAGEILLSQKVQKGDIFRMCQVKDKPIQNWVKLAVDRARITMTPAIFWLDNDRAHHRQLINKVNHYLNDHQTDDLDIQIMSPTHAIRYSLQRSRSGKDTISVTGNVLRDYLTDLFPILELGTSAKMLSIVPLMNGGGLFETGAGGSAPKHIQQFLAEGHLRWDSLGEFLAFAESLAHLGRSQNNDTALIFADTLNQATHQFLSRNKSPSRKVNTLDNRGSHFYLTLYWAQALARQTKNKSLRNRFRPLAQTLEKHTDKIIAEINAQQGQKVDIGGYYHPDSALTYKAMRPSTTFNDALGNFK